MFNMGMGEVLLLLVIAFVVIGPSDFPKVAKGFIKAVRYSKDLAKDIFKSVTVNLEDEVNEVKEVKDLVESTVKSVDTNIVLDPLKSEVTSIVKEFSELKEVVETTNKSLGNEVDALIKGEKVNL